MECELSLNRVEEALKTALDTLHLFPDDIHLLMLTAEVGFFFFSLSLSLSFSLSLHVGL